MRREYLHIDGDFVRKTESVKAALRVDETDLSSAPGPEEAIKVKGLNGEIVEVMVKVRDLNRLFKDGFSHKENAHLISPDVGRFGFPVDEQGGRLWFEGDHEASAELENATVAAADFWLKSIIEELLQAKQAI